MVDVVTGQSLEIANGYHLRVRRVVAHAALMEQWTFYLAPNET